MINKEELKRLKGLSNDKVTIDFVTDFGVGFNLPGHDLYVFNEGQGWCCELKSHYSDMFPVLQVYLSKLANVPSDAIVRGFLSLLPLRS